MSKESLDQFVKEEFLRPGTTQDKLKATESFDDFVNMMVSLGNPKYSFTAEEVKEFVQNEISRVNKAIQDEADQNKAKVEKQDLDAATKADLIAPIQAAADDYKKLGDDAVTTSWKKNRVVENAIVYLKGIANVRPIV